jgi:hypothetical protein
MSSRRELAMEDLERLGHDLRRLWTSVTKDPKKEKRKERGWSLLYGATSAGFALVARRILMRAWPILTGEEPPTTRLRPAEEVQQEQAAATPPTGPSAPVRDPQLDHEREVVGANVRPGAPVDQGETTHETRVEGQPQERWQEGRPRAGEAPADRDVGQAT